MNFSNLWKGLAVVAVLFLFSMEASAQLPVRTQTVQFINGAGGIVTVDASYGTAVTPYTVSWPQTPPGYVAGVSPAASDEAILIGTWTGSNDVNLRWEPTDGFVDGIGADNHVAFWNPDDNTLDAQEAFEFDPATGVFTVGVNNIASGAGATGIEAATAGVIQVGDGTAAESIVLDGTAASGTFGNGTIAGDITITNGAGANTVTLDGATSTVTIGAASIAGTQIMFDPNGQDVTLTSGDHVADIALSYNPTLAGAPAAGFLPISTNAASAATDNYLLISNADGTATWAPNPLTNFKADVYTHAGADTYTVTIAFGTPYAAAPIVNITQRHPTNANILQITATTAIDFTVTSTAPITAGDQINWMANESVNP